MNLERFYEEGEIAYKVERVFDYNITLDSPYWNNRVYYRFIISRTSNEMETDGRKNSGEYDCKNRVEYTKWRK